MKSLVPFLIAAAGVTKVQAFCFEPKMHESPPDFYFVSKPSAPYCLSGYRYSGTHTCNDWEIDSYLSDVDRHLAELNAYVDEYLAFANEAAAKYEEAVEFAQCSAQAATEELR
ncbi:hypothetical protein [Tateyamaria omphalii]|uniref:Uncharacterized protein n=1 Tax=Tateyamaria omphalii TaxID=299262 RepID=A0A1P8MVY1_9RHOB|nr:hypothetical protein [Tateyamaria omphalii]APX12178.1 hypothetical protein BWR18_11175 [Tateyamaria omphalii]